ncbi:MAG TPA: hypothetical protein VKT32_10835 [Chthonomonadaceae bacterium]|nr:hypothetical protein [Chthonomonadaceae bacterium]
MNCRPFQPVPRRTAGRQIGLLFLLAAGLLLLAQNARAVDMETLVGFGQSLAGSARYRPDSWIPLTVYLTGPGARGVGQLQVTVRQGEQTTLYTRRISLHEGPLNEAESFVISLHTPNRFQMFGANPPPDISVQLLLDGRKLAEKTVALPLSVAAESYNVLALTQNGGGLNFLSKKNLGLVHRHVNPSTLQQMNGVTPSPGGSGGSADAVNPSAALTVLYTDPRALPSMPQGYAMIDAIALADLPLDSLTDDQLAALQGYVRDGGLLIVSGGGDLTRLKSRFFAGLLPVAPEATNQAKDLPDLAQRYGAPLPLPAPVALTDGTLLPGARALFDGQGRRLPLISARPYGSGVVVFTAFDYLAPEFRGWKGAPALWRDLLRCGNDAISPRDLAMTSASSATGARSRLADALAGKQASSMPGLGAISLFLGVYIFLLAPVSYLVLKKLDRRELAWITAPILICSFTAGSYAMARSIKGGLLTVNRAVLFEENANTDPPAGYAQWTLYSPRRAAYDIALGDPDDPDNPYRNLAPDEISANGQGSGDLTIEQDKTTTLRGTLVRLWDKRSFETPVQQSLGGPIAATTRLLPNADIEVAITNKTRYALHNCLLLNGGHTVELGDLAAGATVRRTVPLVVWAWSRSGAGSISLPSPPEPTDALNPEDSRSGTPEATRARIQAGLVEMLRENVSQDYGYWQTPLGGSGGPPNAFVGWFDDPVLDIRVDGEKAAGQEVNLLFAHLPPPAGAPPNKEAAFDPFARKPLLKLPDVAPPGRTGIFR